MSDLLNNPISFHDLEYQFATSGVYAIHCQYTDTYYIGQAVVILRRLVDHFSQLREGRHPNAFMQQEFRAVGENQFVIGLVADMPNAPVADLLRRESAEIQRFKAHGKRLYNKVSTTIDLFPTPHSPTTGRTSTSARVPSKSEGTESRVPKLTHAERIDLEDAISVACYDCGMSGLLRINVFICDDGFNRCQPCVEIHLDNWRVVAAPQRKKQSLSPRGGSYRRWLVPQNASVQEHILLAVNNFSQLYGRKPERVFVHPDLYKPNRYRDVEVLKGGIAIGRYIDIPIE